MSLNFNCADEIPSPPSSPIPSNQRIKQQQQQQKASHPPTPPPHGRNHPTLRRLNTTRINNTISIKNSPNSLSPYTTASPSTLSSTADAFEAITLHSGVGSTGILARKSSISSSRYHPPQSPGYRNNTSRSQFPTTGPISAPSSAAALATPQFWNMKSSPDGLDDQQLPPLLNRSYSTNSTSSRYNNNSKDNYQQQQQSHHQRSHTMRYMHKTSDSSSSSSSGASSADDSELESPQLLRSLTNASSKHRFKVHCPKTDAIIALFMDQDNLQLTHLVTKVREKLRLDYLPSLNYRDGVDPTPISLVDTEDLLASLENGGGHLFVSAASAGGNGTQLDLGKLSSWKMMKPSASPPLPPPASHSYDIFDSYN